MALHVVDACAQVGSGDRPDDVVEFRITPERILSGMDAAGVHASIVYPATWRDYELANAEIYHISNQHSNRFIGFARVNPLAPDAERTARKSLEEYGLKGLRLRPYHDGFTLDDPRVGRMFRIAVDHRIPVGVDGEHNKDALFRLVEEHAEIPIVLMHLGNFKNWNRANFPAYIGLLQDAPNFYMATCFEIIHFFLEQIIRAVPTKVVFGSDAPVLPPVVERKRIEIMGLEPEQNTLVFGGNLMKVLRKA
jgi:uncharacterized protein